MRQRGTEAGSQRWSPHLLVVANWLLLMSFRSAPSLRPPWQQLPSHQAKKPASDPGIFSLKGPPPRGPPFVTLFPAFTLSASPAPTFSLLPPLHRGILSCSPCCPSEPSGLNSHPLATTASSGTPLPALTGCLNRCTAFKWSLCLLTHHPPLLHNVRFFSLPHPTTHPDPVTRSVASKHMAFQAPAQS